MLSSLTSIIHSSIWCYVNNLTSVSTSMIVVVFMIQNEFFFEIEFSSLDICMWSESNFHLLWCFLILFHGVCPYLSTVVLSIPSRPCDNKILN